MTTLTLSKAAQAVLEILNNAGYTSFFAGGCVRDRALGIEPKDYDITTPALPEQVSALFEKTLQVGAHFGVVVVIFAGYQFEVATFRTDGEYIDGRRPETVRYGRSVREDVERRDFTINGLVQMSVHDNPMDFVDGLTDLRYKLIRTIGDPEKRFREDALRMLRAVRFVSKLGFSIEPLRTLAAIQKNAQWITQVSRERIREEFLQILTGSYAVEGITALFTSGLAKYVLPDMMDMQLGYTLARFHRFPTKDPILALTMFLSDLAPVDGDPNFRNQTIVKTFKLATADAARIVVGLQPTLRGHAGRGPVLLNAHPARLIRDMRVEGFFLQRAIFSQDVALGKYTGLEAHYKPILDFCWNTSPEVIHQKRFVTGNDLLAMGVKPGAELGQLLDKIEDRQLRGEFLDREDALAYAKTVASVRPPMKVGDRVVVADGMGPLRSGNMIYGSAIVIQTEPTLVLVSESSDMRWESSVQPQERRFRVVGEADQEILQRCMRRLVA
jgi:poly(A) polymerase